MARPKKPVSIDDEMQSRKKWLQSFGESMMKMSGS